MLFLLLAFAIAEARPTAVTLSEELAALAEKAVPAVVLVRVERPRSLAPELLELMQELGLDSSNRHGADGDASGSGFIVSADGRVITNAHVVGGAPKATLVLADQRRLPAHVVGLDPRTDIAVLQIESHGPFPSLPLGDSAEVRVGDVVMAVGNPFEFQSSVTLGIISATGRRGLDEREIQDYIQTDAAVNPGSSGGPLLDMSGRVIGVNTAIFSPAVDQNSGISFAIPSDMVRRITAELDRSGKVSRAWVGLVTETVEEVDGDATLGGAEVVRVVPDGPASKAGLRRGDIVIEVDGEAITTEVALRSLVLVREVGTAMVFTVTRDGQRVDIEVVSGQEQDVGIGLDDLPKDAVYWQGLYLATPNDALRAHFGVGQDRGLLVVRVDPGSAGARLGLKTGDLFLDVSGTPLTDLSVLREILKDEGVVLAGIQRGGSRAHAVLPLP